MKITNISSIEKALGILQTIPDRGDGVSLSDLAPVTGFNSSTVHRLSSILVRRCYLYQKRKRDKYLLGNQFLIASGVAETAAIV